MVEPSYLNARLSHTAFFVGLFPGLSPVLYYHTCKKVRVRRDHHGRSTQMAKEQTRGARFSVHDQEIHYPTIQATNQASRALHLSLPCFSCWLVGWIMFYITTPRVTHPCCVGNFSASCRCFLPETTLNDQWFNAIDQALWLILSVGWLSTIPAAMLVFHPKQQRGESILTFSLLLLLPSHPFWVRPCWRILT